MLPSDLQPEISHHPELQYVVLHQTLGMQNE